MDEAQECIGYLLVFAIADFVKTMQLEAFEFPNGIDGSVAHWQAKACSCVQPFYGFENV